MRGLEGLEEKIISKRQQTAAGGGPRKDNVIRLSNIRKDQRETSANLQQNAAMANQKSEDTLMMEDESFQFAQMTQSLQPFANQQLLNSNLDESSYE